MLQVESHRARLFSELQRTLDQIEALLNPFISYILAILSNPRYTKIFISLSVGVLALIFLCQIFLDPRRLPAGGGMLLILVVSVVLSESRDSISLRTLLGGLYLQILLSFLFFRTRVALAFFGFLHNIFSSVLLGSDAGALFVYGTNFRDHYIAFSVLTSVIFFSALTSLLYYLRVLPVIIKGLGYVFQRSLGITGPESIAAAGNIFLGQTEAPLLLRPLLPHISTSELFLIMTSGFATVAGSMLGVYLSLGISSSYVMIASAMNPVSSTIVAKLMYPHITTESDAPLEEIIEHNQQEMSVISSSVPGSFVDDSNSSNLVPASASGTSPSSPAQEETDMKWINAWEAVTDGATTGAKLAINIGACLLVFVSLMTLINLFIAYVGVMLGFSSETKLSIEMLAAYPLRPVSWLLGISWEESRIVGELLALKIFLTELVAYIRFMDKIREGLFVSERSQMLITFALCSFSNFSSIGIQVGGLGSLVPARRPEVSRLVFRALIAGNLACWLTTTFVALIA